MGTSKLNIWLRNASCDLLTSVWRTDLVVQACGGTYLVDTFPEILEQLLAKYSARGVVRDITSWPLETDQTGRTLEITIGSGSMQSVTFTAPAQSLAEIYEQVVGQFTDCSITPDDDHLKIVTDAYGPNATIVLGGTCDIDWGPIVDGSGYEINSHYYQGAKRIMLMPPAGEYVNHIEMDVPPGCYKVWTRVCHGNNEETSTVMVGIRCGEEACVNLLLSTVKTCSAGVLHPLMDKIVYEQALADDEQRLGAFRGVMFGAQLGKQEVLNQLNYRVLEAQAKQDTELEARINAVMALAQQLPECI